MDKQLSDGEMPRHHGKTGDVVDWSDGLLTGMDDIDDDHRKLIDIINELGRLRGSNSSPDSLIKTFGELKDYTVYHFQREQALMNDWSVNKTHKSMHLKAHAGFIARIEKAGELIDAHPNYVVDHVLGFLVGWLLHHISDVDTSLVKEIENLRDGTKPDASAEQLERRNNDMLRNSISELHDDIGFRSLDMVEMNIRLQDEVERRKQAEDDAQLASLVFENSGDAMTVTDADNLIIAVNPAFTRLTGYQPDEVIGQNPSILSSGRHDEKFYRQMWESLFATGHWDGELWNRHKNGEVFAEAITINTIYSADGSVDRRVAVFSDITEKKRTEEQLARQAVELQELIEKEADLNGRLLQEIAVKNRLFSIVSHDLRSPFTVLNGLTERLVEKGEGYCRDKVITQVNTINRAAKSIFVVVDNLLEWSRAQLDGEKIDIQNIAVRDVVKKTLSALHPVADEKGVVLVNKIVDGNVRADPHYLLTVLRNLVSNAIKFSDSGGIVELNFTQAGDDVEIVVSDTGVGVSDDVIDNIFALDQKTTTKGTAGEKGSGLGLPLCDELVRKMNGSIRLETGSGKGSRFIVVLPAA
ncbi:MAG: PAS domain S-box protein [Rhodospirillaceae bacterium]|nr:PAS domain S-box protein [Rhodospirillaceae bacterium]MBT4220055.1 PAS domain S-box protein [Rhodospirillaceae bacterium]MBT4463484.1 PAS domain S-box protein [Rhodospirillaceae bacterium]MBT5013043.1 PAS domain S-box protein [Rhodospirillaceae bacterium]MBT7355732.1 PAS domain S-box protein [Rhodospirillaceae bacterium]